MSLEACLESSLAGLELGEGRRGEARRAPQVLLVLLVLLVMVMVMVMVMLAVVGLLVVMNH